MAKTILITLAAGVALTCAGPALAMDATPGAEAVQVRFADLDLSRDRGRAVLESRVESAVAKVCPHADNRDIDGVMAMRRCRATVLAAAQQQLASIYASRRYAEAAVSVSAPSR